MKDATKEKIYIISSLLAGVIVFCLYLSFVSAIDYNPIIKVRDCANITIDVSSPDGIKTKDYNFSNCNRIEGNIDKWLCNCNITDDYTLGMLTNNGVNKTFVLGINYTYWYQNRKGENYPYTKFNQGTLTVTSTTTTTTTEKVCTPEILTKYVNITNNQTQNVSVIPEEKKSSVGLFMFAFLLGAFMVAMICFYAFKNIFRKKYIRVYK